MRSPSVIVALALSSTLACRSSEPAAKQPEQGAESATLEAPGAPPPERAVEPAPSPARPEDPEHGDKLQDLDDLCASVDRDYSDGTLGDYYHGLKLRTKWGEAQREAGLESIKPGRLLEGAVNEVDPQHREPTLSHCHTLLDYLDDVE